MSTVVEQTKKAAHKRAGDPEIEATREWMEQPRFKYTTRLHSARQVVAQRGTIATDYTVAGVAATEFYARLRELFKQKKSITSFGPYSPGQAVTMKRVGIEGIYLGGWATSAKGSVSEDPGPDLASYPLSQVPDEAAVIVRALLTADRNQAHQRSRMSEAKRDSTQAFDFRPWIIADADTGHGGDPHVRNLIRRFVEAGVPGYHIEDQRPGTKKCGHQAGKVLVASDEQNKRLNAARLELDVMGVPGIIVARTDAEAANLLDGRGDERDQPFVLGATNLKVPPYKNCILAMIRRFNAEGVDELNGHLLYKLTDAEWAAAEAWLEQAGVIELIKQGAATFKKEGGQRIDAVFDVAESRLVERWEIDAGMGTYGDAVAAVLERGTDGKGKKKMSVEEWRRFASGASFYAAREQARALGIEIEWDCEHAKTPEGYYQVRGGIPYAIAKSLAAAPFADLLWMETKTANLEEAREFADAIHAEFPDQLLAYNLSPSFNWDTTGMSEDEMRAFPEELGKMGFVFNFITYGGHQADGVAAEELATSLQEEGMLALARLQRRIRLLDSPYKTPQTLVGGPRGDAALAASSGRTASTKAMGKGSTQHQHLVQTEVPTSLLEEWLATWSAHNGRREAHQVRLRPRRAGSDELKLTIRAGADESIANVVFTPIEDRQGQCILVVSDQNTFAKENRRKHLMTLIQLWLIHRYKAKALHYVTPTGDSESLANWMKAEGIYAKVSVNGGQIIVASVDEKGLGRLLAADRAALERLIRKES